MNPNLARLQPYPFEKLRRLFAGVTPAPDRAPIDLSIGEPKHPTPDFIRRTLAENLDGLARYPATIGTRSLREAIAGWLERRYALPAFNPDTHVLPEKQRHAVFAINPDSHVLPVNGSREALFALAQTVIDGTHPGALVICPNPFYQIYEGAALLAGASPYYVNSLAGNAFQPRYGDVPDEVWRRTQLLFTCSPGNPTGRVNTIEDWKLLFELSDRHGFVIASDECYSELYYDEGRAPLGALEAAHRLGRHDFARLVVLSSLSKRSNVPGMRSGFVAGDASVLKSFLLYRTYHGGAMNPAVQIASEAAWNDENHVRENRRLYAAKFRDALPLLAAPLSSSMPEGGFYLWIRTPIDDTVFARDLYRLYNVTVLPGSYLAREAHGVNPGANHVRVALVAPHDECVEGVRRITEFAQSL